MNDKNYALNFNKLALRPDDLCPLLGISRPIAYELCKRQDFPAIRVSDRRIIIPIDALNRWLEKQAQEKQDV